ncbi:5-formyltetrahydrofolate cyclo-ligase [Candidatus Omnitrophota bacterium]
MGKTKEQIRKEILQKLSSQGREEVSRKSRVIKKKLFSLPEFKNAKLILFYASMRQEVTTDEMIDEAFGMGKRVALPRCTSQRELVPKEITDRHTDLEKGTYGICEPKDSQKNVPPEDIGAVIVPGVAFDQRNMRLGRGKGYYDRFLEKLPPDTVIIGLAFGLQIVDNLPTDSYDIPVSKVITN